MVSSFAYARHQKQKRQDNTFCLALASKGNLAVNRENPLQGRLMLVDTPSTITYCTDPLSKHCGQVLVREFIRKWKHNKTEALLSFVDEEEDSFLEVSNPYYDPARNIITFEINAHMPMFDKELNEPKLVISNL